MDSCISNRYITCVLAIQAFHTALSRGCGQGREFMRLQPGQRSTLHAREVFQSNSISGASSAVPFSSRVRIFCPLFPLATTLPTEVLIRWAPNGPCCPHSPPNPFFPGYFSASFERLIRENEMADWTYAFALFGGQFLLANVGVRADLLARLPCRHY